MGNPPTSCAGIKPELLLRQSTLDGLDLLQVFVDKVTIAVHVCFLQFRQQQDITFNR